MVMFRGNLSWHEQWGRVELDGAVLFLAKHEVILTIVVRVGSLLLVIIIINAC